MGDCGDFYTTHLRRQDLPALPELNGRRLLKDVVVIDVAAAALLLLLPEPDRPWDLVSLLLLLPSPPRPVVVGGAKGQCSKEANKEQKGPHFCGRIRFARAKSKICPFFHSVISHTSFSRIRCETSFFPSSILRNQPSQIDPD